MEFLKKQVILFFKFYKVFQVYIDMKMVIPIIVRS